MNYAGDDHQTRGAPELLPSVYQVREEQQRQESCTEMIHLEAASLFTRCPTYEVKTKLTLTPIHRQFPGTLRPQFLRS